MIKIILTKKVWLTLDIKLKRNSVILKSEEILLQSLSSDHLSLIRVYGLTFLDDLLEEIDEDPTGIFWG